MILATPCVCYSNEDAAKVLFENIEDFTLNAFVGGFDNPRWEARDLTTPYQEGIKAYRKGRYPEAIQHWQKAASLKDKEAQYQLGLAYANGVGVAANPTLAFQWYERAAQAGHPPSQSNLGFMYATGRGIAQDFDKAVYWYQQAAIHSHPKAQYNLAQLYERGLGVTLDSEQATTWYYRAFVSYLREEDSIGARRAAEKIKQLSPYSAPANEVALWEIHGNSYQPFLSW